MLKVLLRLMKLPSYSKNGKAGGESGILPEMLKAICDAKEIMEMLLS